MKSRSWILKAIGNERRKAENKISQTVANSKSILVEGELDYHLLKKFLPNEITIRVVGNNDGKKKVLLDSKDYTLGIVDMDNDYRGRELEHKVNVIDTNPLCCLFAAHVRDYNWISRHFSYDESQVESIVKLAKYLTNIRLFWSERRPKIPSPIKLIQEFDKERERIECIDDFIEKKYSEQELFSFLCHMFIYPKLPDKKKKIRSLLEEFKKWRKENSDWLLNVGVNDHDIKFLLKDSSVFSRDYVVGIAKKSELLYSKIGKYI